MKLPDSLYKSLTELPNVKHVMTSDAFVFYGKNSDATHSEPGTGVGIACFFNEEKQWPAAFKTFTVEQILDTDQHQMIIDNMRSTVECMFNHSAARV